MIRAIADFPADTGLMLAYAPLRARAGLAALWALDERLAAIVAASREPALGLMKLVWWRDALDRLAEAPRGEPLLGACAEAGIDGPAAAAMTAGWEALLDDPALGEAAVDLHAGARGGGLFALSGALLGATGPEMERLRWAGEGWAMADLARHAAAPPRAAAIRARALPVLERAMARRWPRRLRPIGLLAALALADCAVPPPGPRVRALRVLRHQLTGR